MHPPLEDGQQATYDVGYGIDTGEGIEVPDRLRISVEMGPTEAIVFGF